MDFSIPAAFEADLDWTREFVREEVEPLDLVIPNAHDVSDPLRNELVRPLQEEVKRRGLWAMHLVRPDGARRFGQLEFALLNEVLGRCRAAPVVFGCQAPDAGNMEILGQFGTAAQQDRFLAPLVAGDIASTFSVTEPTGGADPTSYRTAAERDGDTWVLDGEKWFSSGFRYATFALVAAVTAPGAPRHERSTMFIVPTDRPGISVVRDVASGTGAEGPIHAYVRYEGVRLEEGLVLGQTGQAFALMQERLGRARLALASRTVGQLQKALDLLCERVLSRSSGGERLADKQLVLEMVADSWTEVEQFRLLVRQTAWKLDHALDRTVARRDIAAVKAVMPEVLGRVARRAAQVHGSLGVSDEMPFVAMAAQAMALGVADGPTEVHKLSLARSVLRQYVSVESLFPSGHLPALRAQALERYGLTLARFRTAEAGG